MNRNRIDPSRQSESAARLRHGDIGCACRDLAKVAGASIDGDCVRFDPELIENFIAKAPDKVTVHAQCETRRTFTRDTPALPPLVGLLFDRYRQWTSRRQLRGYVQFLTACPVAEYHPHGRWRRGRAGRPANTRHLDMYMAFATLTDKTWTGYALGADRAQDSIEMAAMAAGLSLEEVVDKPVVLTVINSNSPAA